MNRKYGGSPLVVGADSVRIRGEDVCAWKPRRSSRAGNSLRSKEYTDGRGLVYTISLRWQMRIERRLCCIVGIAMAVAGCVRTAPNRAHGATYTAGNEQELQAGVNRLQQLKQDLLQERFRVVSRATSEAADTFNLAGSFGSLKD